MTAINFKVIGIDDITTNASERFTSCATDGGNVYVASQNLNSKGNVWKYGGGKWAKLNDENTFSSHRSITSIAYNNGSLYAGTENELYDFAAGKIYVNDGLGSGWVDKSLTSTGNFNSAIRSIIFVGDDIYAAGAYYGIWKYSNGSWSESYLNGTRAFINDLVENNGIIYAATCKSLRIAEVLKYDGTSWSQINTDLFSDLGNVMTTKLCWYDGYLYAATFNDITGTEIWRYNGTSWSQINTDGFGSANNYTTVSMAVVDSQLVIATENPRGGEVWSYTVAGGWQQQTVNSDVLYQSYLIQKTDNTNYLIGRARKYLLPDASPTVMYTKAQRYTKKLSYWPDGSIGGLPIGGGQYRFFGPNSAYTAITEGTLEDPAQSVVSPTLPYNQYLYDADPTTGGIVKGTQFSYLKPDFPVVSAGLNYYAGGSVYKDPDTGTVLMFCHTEKNYNSNTGQWDGNIRLAVSQDDGLTFSDVGNILAFSGPNRSDSGPVSSTSFNGAYPILKDNYLYLYYSRERIGRDPYASFGDTLNVARALKSDVVTSALKVSAAPWTNYYSGAYTEPSLSGQATDLIDAFEFGAPWATAFYCSSIGKFVYIANCLFQVLETNLYAVKNSQDGEPFAIFSDDGINWSFPERLCVNPVDTTYSTVLFSSMHTGVCDKQFYLLNTRGTGWSNNTLESYSISAIPFRSVSRSFNVESYISTKPYSPSLAWDRGQLHPFIAAIHYVKEQAKLFDASSYYYNNLSSLTAESNWKNVLQSYANSATELSSGFPNSFDDYINFGLGRDFHKFYYDYTHNFKRHRLTPAVMNLDGPTIFGHTFGSIIKNSKLSTNGSLSKSYPYLITSSLDNVIEFTNNSTIFNISGTASGTYIASTTADVYVEKFEYRNSGILSHIEFVETSTAGSQNSFTVLRLNKTDKIGSRYNSLLHENTLIKQKSYDGLGRITFDLSKYQADSNEGYDVQTNFLSPDHKFKINFDALISNTQGTILGGGALGIWIHTKSEGGKIWSYTKDKIWVQHDVSALTIADTVNTYSNLFNLPTTNRNLEPANLRCSRFLNTATEPDVIASLSESDFTTIELEFDTDNSKIINSNGYFTSYGNVHRLNQSYVVEVFTNPFPGDKFTLLYNFNMFDVTLNKWSKPLVGGIRNNSTMGEIYCQEFRVDLSRDQVLAIIKYLNDLTGAYSNFGYASRVATYTSGVYEASGGSRINYVESPDWSPVTKNSGDLITLITLNN